MKPLILFAEHDASNLPDDTGHIEVSIKGAAGDNETEEMAVSWLIEMYAEVWGCNPDRIYRVDGDIPTPHGADMNLIWQSGGIPTKEEIDHHKQEIARLQNQVDRLEKELDRTTDYCEQLEDYIPKKKYKKMLRERRHPWA